MPRQPKHLPYIRLNRAGRLQYYRRIPADRRHLFGNKGAFTLVLDCDPSKPRSKAARHAWKQADDAYEQQLAGNTALKPQIPAPDVVKPAMSPRDLAGLAAEPLKSLLNKFDSGNINDEMWERLRLIQARSAEMAHLAETSDDAQLIAQQMVDVALLWTQETLNQRRIRPNGNEMLEIAYRLDDYLAVLVSDLKKREQSDYSISETDGSLSIVVQLLLPLGLEATGSPRGSQAIHH